MNANDIARWQRGETMELMERAHLTEAQAEQAMGLIRAQDQRARIAALLGDYGLTEDQLDTIVATDDTVDASNRVTYMQRFLHDPTARERHRLAAEHRPLLEDYRVVMQLVGAALVGNPAIKAEIARVLARHDDERAKAAAIGAQGPVLSKQRDPNCPF